MTFCLLYFKTQQSSNLYRQEINTSASPLIDVLDNVSWFFWLLSFLLIIAVIVIDGLIRYNKKSSFNNSEKLPIIKSEARNDGQSLAAGRDINFHQTIINQGKDGEEAKSKIEKARKNVDPQRFYWRTIHFEYKVNGNADVVNNFLLQSYTGIMHIEEIDNSTYFINEIRAFNPKEHDTFQYGLIVGGYKETARHKYLVIAGMRMTPNPLIERLPEMFFITISQGQKDVSIVSFDTDIRQFHLYADVLVQELSKAFTVNQV